MRDFIQKRFAGISTLLMAMLATICLLGMPVQADEIVIDESFTNADGYCYSITYENGYWSFEDPIYETGIHYVKASKVAGCVANIPENQGVFITVRSLPDNATDIKLLNTIGKSVKSHSMYYSFCLSDTVEVKDFTIKVDNSVTGVSFEFNGGEVGSNATLTVECPNGIAEYESVGIYCNYNVKINCDVQGRINLGSCPANVYVNGDINYLDYYNSDCSYSNNYTGTVTATGKVAGIEHGVKILQTKNLGNINFDAIVSTFSNQTGTIIKNGKLVCTCKKDTQVLTEDMFTYTYCTQSQSTFQQWYVNILPKDTSSHIGLNQIFLTKEGNGEEDEEGIWPDFTPADIPAGANVYVGGTDFLPNQTLTLPNDIGEITISEGWVDIEGHADWVAVSAATYRPDLCKTAKIKVTINGTTDLLTIDELCYGADISVGAKGKVVYGQRTPIHSDTRFFGEQKASTTIMSDGSMSIMTYESLSYSGTGVITPSEQDIADMTDSDNITISLDYDSENELSTEEKNNIDDSIEDAGLGDEADIESVIDIKVESYELMDDGTVDEDSFSTISELSKEVDFTYSIEDENAEYVVVRLHETGDSTQASVLDTDQSADEVSFSTDKFSKYVLVKLDSHKHTYKTVTTKATVSANGKKVTKCSICGKIKKTVTIYKASKLSLSVKAYTYNGKVQKPTVTVKNSKGKTIAKSNYTVTYSKGRKNIGTYTVKITFKGYYKGSKTFKFTINPKKTTLSKIKALSKSFKVTWTKVNYTGYELQYSVSKTFKTNAKTVKITKNTTTSQTVKGLKAGKKYYVRIRTYKKVGKTTYYSAWSKSLTVTTKK